MVITALGDTWVSVRGFFFCANSFSLYPQCKCKTLVFYQIDITSNYRYLAVKVIIRFTTVLA